MEQDYYQILGVKREAKEREIKRAYHRLARERHPDKAGSPDEAKRLQEEFAWITTAYNTLKDKQKRAEYDAHLQKQRKKESGGDAVETKAAAAPAKTGGSAPGKGASVQHRASIAQRAYTKGVQLFAAGDYDRACEFFEAAIKNNDSEAMYYAKLGQAMMKAHKGFSQAVRAMQRAIELDPYNTEHRLALGKIYETVGSTSLAIKMYKEILKWDPTHAETLERLALLGEAPGQSFFDRFFQKLKRR
jgi:tetratricopeptide (TPR) repeat protein